MSDRQSFVLVNERVRNNAIEALRNAPDNYVVTIAEPLRTLDQNAMFHAICSDIAKSGLIFARKPRTAAVWKVLLISAHAEATKGENGEKGNEVVPGLEGEFVNIRESSALMSVRRANSLISYTLAFCDTNQIPLTETKRGGFLDEREGRAA